MYRGGEESRQSQVYMLQLYPSSRLEVLEDSGYTPVLTSLFRIAQDTTSNRQTQICFLYYIESVGSTVLWSLSRPFLTVAESEMFQSTFKD